MSVEGAAGKRAGASRARIRCVVAVLSELVPVRSRVERLHEDLDGPGGGLLLRAVGDGDVDWEEVAAAPLTPSIGRMVDAPRNETARAPEFAKICAKGGRQMPDAASTGNGQKMLHHTLLQCALPLGRCYVVPELKRAEVELVACSSSTGECW